MTESIPSNTAVFPHTPDRSHPAAQANSLRWPRALALSLVLHLSACGGGGGAAGTQIEPVAGVAPELTLAALGERIFTDANLSEPRGTACVACHRANLGFAGNNGSTLGVALGSHAGALGLRNAMTNSYSNFIPSFGYITVDGVTEPVGGLFWDGRADTLALQALGPLLNPLEMNNSSAPSVVDKIARSNYAEAFKKHFGADIFTSSRTDQAFSRIGEAIAAFESSPTMQSFSSKFDAMVLGQASFTPAEERGMALFSREDKGNCAACHTMNLQSGNPRDSLFTDFTYYATGVPRNAKIPRNADPAFFDLGLCGPDRAPPVLPANAPAELTQDSLCGKFRMPTLRNAAERPAFMHNGAFKTLREVLVFYANRHSAATSDDLPAKYQINLEKGKPPFNRSPSAGPALNEAEINDMLSFLRTLSDGFVRTP